MPGSITLPQIVLDLEEEDRKQYEALKPPSSMVVRYGHMRMIAELPYDGEAKPGCGSKLVIRSPRGIELATMLTSTCPNAGCGHAVTRKQMLDYIENSGGRDYPFTTNGKILRVATVDDLNEQARLDAGKADIIRFTRRLIAEQKLNMKLVEVELLLGGERLIFHYTAEQWVDFRELVRLLAQEYRTRIEMHQVNARDEARLVADYEKCGQHCCCRQFLKVLKPVSMRSAKIQKATLDPAKISGRCGRLMCCLRYEDTTYDELRKRLPHRNSRVMTEDGPGTVVDTQILTQLALIRLDHNEQAQAFPVENIRALSKEEDRRLREEAEAQRQEQAASWSARNRDRERDRSPRGRGNGNGGHGEGDRRPDRGEATPGPATPPPVSRGYRNRQQASPPAEPDTAAERDKTSESPVPPRRPQPGRPLAENEIEAKEGPPVEGALDGAGEGASSTPPDSAAGQDAGQDTGQDVADQGRRKRRRRRRGRRRRGRGGGGDAGGGQS